jgi:hypothetical protein
VQGDLAAWQSPETDPVRRERLDQAQRATARTTNHGDPPLAARAMSRSVT